MALLRIGHPAAEASWVMGGRVAPATAQIAVTLGLAASAVMPLSLDAATSPSPPGGVAQPQHLVAVGRVGPTPRNPRPRNALLSDSFATYTGVSTLTDGEAFGPWRVVFAGFGSVTAVKKPTTALRLRPAASTTPSETHAALVVSKPRFDAACLRVGARIRTVSQLRRNSRPNPWETGWLILDYTDNYHFIYLALKTNGWELGKRDPAYAGGQRFLATGDRPVGAAGAWRRATVTRTAGASATTISVTVDGKRLVTYADTERPYRSGAVGVYTEDAAVDVDHIYAKRC